MGDRVSKLQITGKQGFTKLGDLADPLPFKPKKVTRHESRLVRAALETRQTPPDLDSDLSYWPRGLIQCTLPHSNPGDVPDFSRRSNDFYLLIQPGRLMLPDGHTTSFGFPYGSYPRLVCSYLSREVKRTCHRTIELGDTLTAFMRELGLSPTGGRWGTIPNLRKQVLALLNAKISFGYGGSKSVDAGGNRIFADEYQLWWDNGGDQTALFPTYVRLSEPLFEEIMEHAFPCDMRILRALKQSSLALDLYAWATAKVHGLKSKTAIPWKGMHAQFGSEYRGERGVKNFRRKAVDHLAVIKTVYPDFKYTLERGRLIIWPSNPSVLPLPPRN